MKIKKKPASDKAKSKLKAKMSNLKKPKREAPVEKDIPFGPDHYMEGSTGMIRRNPKKYSKGGKYDMYQKGGGVTVTKKMVDDEFKKTFESSANLTNDLARQLAKGVDSKGMPLKPAAKKALAAEVKKRKAKDQAMKPNYRYVGSKVPGGKSPSFKKGGKMYLTGGQVKLDKNKDGKITGEDFKIMKAKKYAQGGVNDPEEAKKKLASLMSKSKEKGNPTAVLQRLTTNAIREELRKAGVGGKYAIGEKGSVEGDYGKLVSLAKEKGVYDTARSAATKEFKENYGKPGYQFLNIRK